MKKLSLSLLVLAALLGCHRSDSKSVSHTASSDGGLVAPLAPSSSDMQFSGGDAHLDFSAMAQLAQYYVGGWIIDFGSPAQSQYTMGSWRTGWGARGQEQDVSYSEVGSRGRMYISLDRPSALRISLRVKAAQAMPITLYFNDGAVESSTLVGAGAFEEVHFNIPAERTRPGENIILFHFGKPQMIKGAAYAGRVDWVRVQTIDPSGQSATVQPIMFSELVGKAKVGDDEKPAFRLPGQSRLRFMADVPMNAQFEVSAGSEQAEDLPARVELSVEGKAPQRVWEGKLKDRWQKIAVPVTDSASPVRIDLIADGNALQRVAWNRPRLVLQTSATPAGSATPKHVIILLIDTQRADKFSAYNPSTRVKSPTIDTLAKEGALFEQAQSPENWTKPSCATVLTGLHPQTHRQKFDDSALPSSALLLSEHLKTQGYATAMFSANGYVSDKFGFKQGWDYYTNYIREEKATIGKVVFSDAAKWIETNKDKPFFVYIQTIEPHVPYDPPGEFLKMYETTPYTGSIAPRQTPDILEKAKRVPPAVTFSEADKKHLVALYDGEVTSHDTSLGIFIERLKTLGIWNETLLVVTADHGEELNDHGSWGHGHSVYQELLHVPLFFRLPGRIPAGLRVRSTVGTLDIVATVMDILGKPALPADEGHSLAPFFDGTAPQYPLVAFSDFQDDRRVVRAGRWKYILRGNLSATLFDLASDPGEKTALNATAFPIAQSYCRAMLGQFLGSKNLRDWYLLKQDARSAPLKQENAVMDEATKAQLKALGYAN